MTETQNTECCAKPCAKWCGGFMKFIVILLLLINTLGLCFISYDLYFKNGWAKEWTTNSTTPTTANTATWDNSKVKLTAIVDKRCSAEECPVDQIITQLKSDLPGVTINQIDYSEKEAKSLLKDAWITTLPAFIFSTNEVSNANMKSFLKETKDKKYYLEIGSTFDPTAEVCGNDIDDNNDGLKDCEDAKVCGKTLECSPKVDKPVADLYIMSYCPYWLQAQKGYLEVMSKLWKVADVNVKWVPYVMHEQKEADENVVQECIQKDDKQKYTAYLNCFLAKEGQGEACRKEAKIDEAKLQSCITETKKTYKVDENMADKSKQYPAFDINKDEATAAWVEWSPTFVLNWVKVDKVWRNAKAYADAICSTFKNKPAECSEKFQDVNFDPMFGFTTWNGAASADSGCGQ